MRARLALLMLVVGGACQTAGPAAGPTTDPVVPVLAPGSLSREAEAEAERLYESAEASFAARRFPEVLRTTSDLMERYPSSRVSGAALLLSARAESELGNAEQADEAAQRYVGLLPAGDPRVAEARLLQAAAWQGRPDIQLDRLLRLDASTPREQLEAALPLARAATDSLDFAGLETLLGTAPSGAPLAPILQAAQAVNLLERGDSEGAALLARAALEGGAPPAERDLAEAVLRGELPPGRGRVTSFAVGVVLPESGPPALAEFARQVREGVEVAMVTVLPDDYQVSLADRDDEADPSLSAVLMGELETAGAVGAVGFLEDDALLAAAQARLEGLPIVSPTARTAELAGEGVYSLEGPDPIAAREVARYAATRAYQRVVVILPSSDAAIEEADAFEAEAARFGIPVVDRFYYEPGETFFETQIIGAERALRASEIAALRLGEEDTLHVEVLEPVGIFLPIPREDVEFLGPQLAHFALDTLAVELVGTSAWTDPGVLEVVEPLYLNGVVATSVVGSGPTAPGMARFRAAYEEHFQRSLVSSTPAIGYDAALLLLEALRAGRVEPAQVMEEFRRLRDVEGATGIFSVIDDRVVRRTEVVRIRNRRLEPVETF